MCSLAQFPELPPFGQVNVCEVEGKIQSLSFDTASHCQVYTNAVAQHPKVKIPQEIGAASLSRSDASRVFLAGGDSLLKKVVTTWYEEGLLAALAAVSRDTSGHSPQLLRRCAQILLTATDSLTRLRNIFHPHLREKGDGLTVVVSQCRDWRLSPVRCLDWHPHATKLAVGLCNDSVRVYSVDSPLEPILKCQQQVAVSCLAWRPFSTAEIAVGCHNGVFLWSVDPSSVVARPSVSCAQHLKRPGHGPVTAVAWAPQGDLLATASAADATMYIWDPAQERSAPLRRLGGGGVCLAAWSPTGQRLFAATAGVVFRVWGTQEWTPERWSTQCGRVQTACWSPCGSILLFCTTAEPIVYSLRFDSAASAFGNSDVQAATAVIDLTAVEINKEGDRVGGQVTSMVWDRLGRHLAVLFRDSRVVAIFRTNLGILINIAPCCFVNGLPGESPSTIAFQNNFEEGSVLTIAWSSGRLQHFPILASDLEDASIASASHGKSRNLSSSRLNNSSMSRLF